MKDKYGVEIGVIHFIREHRGTNHKKRLNRAQRRSILKAQGRIKARP